MDLFKTPNQPITNDTVPAVARNARPTHRQVTPQDEGIDRLVQQSANAPVSPVKSVTFVFPLMHTPNQHRHPVLCPKAPVRDLPRPFPTFQQ